MDAELSLRHDNNVSRAENGRDVVSDDVAGLDLTLRRNFMLGEHSGVQLRGGVRFAQFARFDELSHLDFNLAALYRIQPVKTYTAPWFEAALGAERQEYRDSDIREGDKLNLDLVVGKRFTDRLRLRAGYGWERRFADAGEVFAWRRRTAHVAADFRVSPRLTLYGEASRSLGDQVFTATPALAFRNAAKAIADDPVFGARRAYRLGAQANLVELGGSFNINANNTLDVGMRRFEIEADGGHNYDGMEVRASWLYRFQ